MTDHDERLRRWRLILGGNNAEGTGYQLSGRDIGIDETLAALYGLSGGGSLRKSDRSSMGQRGGRQGGMEASMPNVSRWLGDIREYFPASVVQVMQQDAIDRIGLQQLLQEPEILETIEPDVHLVATLLSLNSVIPEQTKATARVVVKKVVDDLLKRLENPMRQAIAGSLNRSIRNRRPKFKEINWHRTIQLNLKHYQPTFKTVIPEHLMGYGRRRSALKDIIICIDESGSMATSIVYASVFGAVMASIPSLKTSLVVFDTSVVDLTPNLQDPVDVLFGTQLGGGTNIAQALAYCQRLITRPNDTVFVLISDLYEGGNRHEMLSRVKSMKQSGVKLVTLLALNDEGAPSYDRQTAAHFAEMGIPSFACTPDLFPDLMATVLNRGDVSAWAARHEIPLPQTDDLE